MFKVYSTNRLKRYSGAILNNVADIRNLPKQCMKHQCCRIQIDRYYVKERSIFKSKVDNYDHHKYTFSSIAPRDSRTSNESSATERCRKKKQRSEIDYDMQEIISTLSKFRASKNKNDLSEIHDIAIFVPPKYQEKAGMHILDEYSTVSGVSEMTEDMDFSFNETRFNTNIKPMDYNTNIWNVLDSHDDHFAINSKAMPNIDSKKSKLKSKSQFKLDLHKNDLYMKQEIQMICLKSFLAVCIRNELNGAAHSVLQHYRHGFAWKVVGIDIKLDCYNVVLQGWGTKRNFKRVNEVFQWMQEDQIKPTSQTYMNLLECLSDLDRKWQLRFIKRILLHMEANDVKAETIFDSAIFVKDHKQKILKAIIKVQPDFKPASLQKPKKYQGKLLKNLNTEPTELISYDVFGDQLSRDELRKMLQDQIEHEKIGQMTIKSIVKSEKSPKYLKDMRSLVGTCENEWSKTLHGSFTRNLKYLKRYSASHKTLSIYPYLTVLKPDVIVDIMLQEIRKLAESSETFSPVVAFLYRTIASRIMNRYLILEKEHAEIDEKVKMVCEDYHNYLYDPNTAGMKNHREKFQEISNDHFDGPTMDNKVNMWPNQILTMVGKFLYSILLHDIKVDSNIFKSDGSKKNRQLIPAFYNIYRNNGLFVKEEIKAHPILVKLYSEAENPNLTFDCNSLPMVVPPLPWSSPGSGGYLLSNVPFIRLPDSTIEQWRMPSSIDSQQLFPAFDSLNVLGGCAWILNKPILDAIIEIFNNKGSEKLDIPRPSSECPPPPKFTKNMTKAEKITLNKERINLKRKKSDMYSLWCDALYKLSIANHFREKVFWFPHNLDFRGRVYPCPPHFNHLGSDVTRSMLLFAKGKPLGKDGLNWLKLHAINLTGFKKKEPVEERLKYANELLPEILKSADHPLMEDSWWMKSDEPWQTLACCMEIAKAVRSPNPEEYICHFPVHQDGSCNGLQHYAALGRDQDGAEQVNLHPADIPQDVYSGVAALVELERQKDAADGNKIAKILEGHITRKVVKQTVMTVVYGVTRYGAKLQIYKQLKDLEKFPQEHSHLASQYLVNKTFNSIQKMFTATREIQDWFTECAKKVTVYKQKPIEWITPLGLPVIQPYHKSVIHKATPGAVNALKSVTEKKKIVIKPNVMKQKNAFPPNFIHSLDSSHMMLTSLFCFRAGISFVSVHDCFWTHPNTVDIMNKICREQFVALHDEPILQNLSDYMIDRYCFSNDKEETIDDRNLYKILSSVPKKGNFDLKGVLNSVYFFS